LGGWKAFGVVSVRSDQTVVTGDRNLPKNEATRYLSNGEKPKEPRSNIVQPSTEHDDSEMNNYVQMVFTG